MNEISFVYVYNTKIISTSYKIIFINKDSTFSNQCFDDVIWVTGKASQELLQKLQKDHFHSTALSLTHSNSMETGW